MRTANIQVKEVAFHRNGVCGEPFHVVTFKDVNEDTNMVAIVFTEPAHVAVLCMDQLPGVAFGSNSWRGDCYEEDLRKAVEEYDK